VGRFSCSFSIFFSIFFSFQRASFFSGELSSCVLVRLELNFSVVFIDYLSSGVGEGVHIASHNHLNQIELPCIDRIGSEADFHDVLDIAEGYSQVLCAFHGAGQSQPGLGSI